MKFSAILLGAALYLVSSTEASISTNTPFNAVTWNGGNSEQIVWADDGNAPPLSQIGLTTIDLMAGGPKSQFLAGNIGTIDASVGKLSYTVPKTIGPPGNFYFIKYSAANNFVAFSGTFSIAGVSGTINGFDPKNPNGTASATPTSPAANPASPANPGNSTNPLNSAPSVPPSSQASSAPPPPAYPAKNPADTLSNSTSSSDTTAKSTATKSPLPATLSNAANLLPGFAGVATTVIALTLTCLY